MITRGHILPDGHGNEVWYPDPNGDWWQWGTCCFRKRRGFDWLYWIAKRIENLIGP